jgi:hypothetical protein
MTLEHETNVLPQVDLNFRIIGVMKKKFLFLILKFTFK